MVENPAVARDLPPSPVLAIFSFREGAKPGAEMLGRKLLEIEEKNCRKRGSSAK
jgi:hypothetical protein